MFDERFATSNNVLCLVSEKACRMDFTLELRRVGFGEVAGSFISVEKRWRNHIHPHIGALGRQDDSDQKLKRVRM
jgi:hypothetical protein